MWGNFDLCPPGVNYALTPHSNRWHIFTVLPSIIINTPSTLHNRDERKHLTGGLVGKTYCPHCVYFHSIVSYIRMLITHSRLTCMWSALHPCGHQLAKEQPPASLFMTASRVDLILGKMWNGETWPRFALLDHLESLPGREASRQHNFTYPRINFLSQTKPRPGQ